MSDTITIMERLESQNELDKMHWAIKSRRQKVYENLVWVEMVNNKIRKARPGEVFKLKITVHRKRLIEDYWNIAGGLKLLLDALSHPERRKPRMFKGKLVYPGGVGLIWDDSIKYIGQPMVSQEKGETDFIVITRIKK